MSAIIRTSKKDIIGNYLATFFSIGSGVIVLPLILHFLSEDEVGFNYLMLTITSMISLMDFGFSPQIGRNITYALSGAKEIEKEGLLVIPDNSPNYYLLGLVIEAAKWVYRRLAFIVLCVLLFLGTPYMYFITNGFNNVNNSLIAWILFCISSYLNVYYIYYRSLLSGSGKIYESSMSLILSKSTFIVLCALMLFFGCGLISVVIANLAAPIIQYIYSHIIFYTPFIKKKLPNSLNRKDVREAVVAMWYNAKKLGVNSLGTFAALKLNMFLIGMFLPLAAVASFGVLTQIIQSLSSVASALFHSFLPQFASLQLSHNNKEIIRKLSITTLLYWLTFLLSGLLIIILLPYILDIIGSRIRIPAWHICLLYLVIMLLEGNHSNFASIITTANKVPFVKAGLLSGAFIAILTIVVLKYTPLGLLGVVLVQGGVQLAYNNWKWPRYVLCDLNVGLKDFIYIGYKECFELVKWGIKKTKIDM